MKGKLCLIMMFSVLAACQRVNLKESVDNETAIKVTIEPITTGESSASLHYSGTIEPSQSIALMFKTTGTVEDVFVDEGDLVKKGQALATINKSTAQNLYDASKASYEQAKDAYDRLKEVYEKGSLTDIKWVEMETKFKQAESQMLIMQSNLDDCTLRAPDNGMIGRRNAEPGQSSVGINAPFELVKIDKILVKVSVPENEIGRISKGMKAIFKISALEDQSFGGTVSKVGIMADRISRTYEVSLLAENPGYRIKPGMVCDVSISLPGKEEITVVPSGSVSMDDQGQHYVWRVDTTVNMVTRVDVRIGSYRQGGIEVYSGLKTNDLVVVGGKEKLSENSAISF